MEIGDISELGRCSLNITKEEFFVSDNDDNYILLIYHKIANGSANQYYVDLKEVLPSIKSITEFTNIKATKKQTRSVSASILAAGTMPLEYRIGNMRIEFLKKIRLFPPSRRANPFGHAAQDNKLKEDGSNATSVMNTIQSSNSNEFKRLIRELNNIVQINDVMTPPRGSDVTIKIEEEGGLASQIDLGNMSYGLQQILILLLAIMETEINETVCTSQKKTVQSEYQRYMSVRILSNLWDQQQAITVPSLSRT